MLVKIVSPQCIAFNVPSKKVHELNFGKFLELYDIPAVEFPRPERVSQPQFSPARLPSW